MADWIDPRTKPAPPYGGRERPLAKDHTELTGLVAACKDGRFYDAEAWIANGRPMQIDPGRGRRGTRPATPLSVSIAVGSFDLVRLFVCNGYRMELEPSSPLNDVLKARRWDLLDLLLDWGADPKGAEVWRILDTYQRSVFERFRAAGVDLTAGDAMADALASSTRNRPLYGFARAYRESDPRIQRALDVGLGAAIKEKSDKAVSLCLWAGADPRRRVGELGGGPEEDADGLTALERAVSADVPSYLKKLGFDAAQDEIEPLYGNAHNLSTLRALVAIRPPEDWHRVALRFLSSLAISVRLSLRMTSLWEVEQVFTLGGRLGALDPHARRELRRLLLGLGEGDAQRLFRLLREPTNMDRQAFFDLLGHEKLAARYATWSWRDGVDKTLWAELAAASGVPGVVRRLARARLTPPRKVISQTCLEEAGAVRVLSREDLYELVWSEPLLSLSKRFGLSDNGLRKRCKAMNVPTPPKGYWQQVRHGHLRKPPPLRPTSK